MERAYTKYAFLCVYSNSQTTQNYCMCTHLVYPVNMEIILQAATTRP